MRVDLRAATAYRKVFMSQPWFLRYQALYDDIGKYEDQTLFPVHLGDKLDGGRYVVSNKLGSGSKSNIWLAKDQDLGSVVKSSPLFLEVSVC
jgi:hypothetical protein